MKSKFFILIALTVFFSSCTDEMIEPEPPPTRSFRNLTYKDVPYVVSKLQEGLGLRGDNKRLSVNEGDRTYGVIIDWERITELVDTVGNTNYTFAVVDEDQDPYTFHNLIIGKNEQGYWKRPYLLTYIMGDEFKAQYDATGSTKGFTGKLLKRYINSGLSTQRSVSNEDYYGDPYASGGDPCDREINVVNVNPSSGGLPNDQDIPDLDLDYEVCYGVWVDFESETNCSSGYNSDGLYETYCEVATPTPYLSIVCEELAMSAADDAYGSCNNDMEEVAILEPELDALLWLESICETDAFKNNSCVQDVWTKMKENDVAFNSLTAFLGDKPIAELCFDIKDLNDPTRKTQAQGKTQLTGTSTKALVTISINSTLLNRSKLDIARTIIHESIHAELFAMIVEAGGRENFNNYVTNNPGKSDFVLVWDYIQGYLPPNGDWQHEYMADYYITAISNGLKELSDELLSDTFKNYYSGSTFYPSSGSDAVIWDWDNFYEAVAWVGLKETSEWGGKDPIFQNKYNTYAQYLKDTEVGDYKCN